MSWSGVKKQTNIENIKAWCEEMGIENYTINSQGEIDVDGNVRLSGIRNFDFEELPYKFGRVNGYFDLSFNNNLTSLKNCPSCVGGYFACSFCLKLNSLEGCPKKVDGNFYCDDCKLFFTKEEVRSLCNVKQHIYIL